MPSYVTNHLVAPLPIIWAGYTLDDDAFGRIPDQDSPIADARRWLQQLRVWKEGQYDEWRTQPLWTDAPAAATTPPVSPPECAAASADLASGSASAGGGDSASAGGGGGTSGGGGSVALMSQLMPATAAMAPSKSSKSSKWRTIRRRGGEALQRYANTGTGPTVVMGACTPRRRPRRRPRCRPRR